MSFLSQHSMAPRFLGMSMLLLSGLNSAGAVESTSAHVDVHSTQAMRLWVERQHVHSERTNDVLRSQSAELIPQPGDQLRVVAVVRDAPMAWQARPRAMQMLSKSRGSLDRLSALEEGALVGCTESGVGLYLNRSRDLLVLYADVVYPSRCAGGEVSLSLPSVDTGA